MIYVDPLLKWPTRIRCFKDGSSHLFADTVTELHQFAGRLMLSREWFQDKPGFPHYDLTVRKRSEAVRLGAVELERNAAIAKWRELKTPV
jgi:hypothetical protein